MQWFSACLRTTTYVDEFGASSVGDVVVLFRSQGWDDAFVRALELGRGQETTYRNGAGDNVRVRFKEVVTLDVVPEPLDGVEVFARRDNVEPSAFTADETYAPERSRPSQTI